VPLPLLANPNANTPGLGIELVPIHATELRVCKYATLMSRGRSRLVVTSQLVASGFVPPPEAQRFQEETNHLARYEGGTGAQPPHFTMLVVTFANTTQRVNVLDAVGAAPPLNGRFLGVPTTRWNRELEDFAIGLTGTRATCTLGQSYAALPNC
jgi:hypothetical protein